jgi:hypothetical protein
MNQLSYRQPKHVKKPKHCHHHTAHPLPLTAEKVGLARYRKQPENKMATNVYPALSVTNCNPKKCVV